MNLTEAEEHNSFDHRKRLWRLHVLTEQNTVSLTSGNFTHPGTQRPEAYDILTSPLFLSNDLKFLGINPKGPYLGLEKKNIFFALCSPTSKSGCVKLGSFTWQSSNDG